ncbi:MAG: hypothetical protein NWF07_13825 [Candidatus Bathyarchaeota archaeon]|nr:hypothetical protein [Candidatus Bathyarchaeota archaeon]
MKGMNVVDCKVGDKIRIIDATGDFPIPSLIGMTATVTRTSPGVTYVVTAKIDDENLMIVPFRENEIELIK